MNASRIVTCDGLFVNSSTASRDGWTKAAVLRAMLVGGFYFSAPPFLNAGCY